MQIVVFGASGGVGRQVVEQLLTAGHEVTAIVRDAGKLAMRHPALGIAEVADLSRPEDFTPALAGKDAVMSGVGPRSLKDGPIASTVTASILAGMRAAGLRRLIVVSAAPVGKVPEDEGLFGRLLFQPLSRRILRPIFSDLEKMEAAMRDSGVDYTAVRPPRLTDGPLTGKYRKRIGGSLPRAYMISRADTAHAMCAALEDGATIGQPVGVAN